MKLTVKVTSALLIFVIPIALVLNRYSTGETTQSTGLGVVPSLIIIGIGAVAYGFVSQQFLEMVRTDKFGFLSIAFFGALVGILAFSALFILESIKRLAETNYERFIDIFNYHQETLLYVLISVIVGIAEILIYRASQIKIKRP